MGELPSHVPPVRHIDHRGCAARLATVEAERDRLRAALEHIANDGCDDGAILAGDPADCLSRWLATPDRWCPSCVATVTLLGGA